MIDLSKTEHPDFTLLSKGVLSTSDPTVSSDPEAAGPTAPGIDRAVRALRVRTGADHGRSLVGALHAVESNLDSDGVATALSDPSIQRRKAAMQALAPVVEGEQPTGPSQTPRLA